jgi:branched-chain amino acid transport system permease protein
MIWTNAVLQGLLLGGVYALFACGLSLMFGVMRIVNLAHGDMSVLAAYAGYALVAHLGGDPLWTFAAVIPVAALVGFFLQKTLLNRAISTGALSPLLVTFGLSIIIENGLQQIFGANDQRLNIGSLAYESFRITNGLFVAWFSLLIFGVAIAVLIGLQMFLAHTRQGRIMRACADDQRAAALCGVDPKRTYSYATAIALATVAAAGLFLAMSGSFAPTAGSNYLIYAFETVVIGGLGSLWGTLIGGLVLGVAQTVGSQFNPSDGVLIGHLVFLSVLIFRPRGILSHGSSAVAAAVR